MTTQNAYNKAVQKLCSSRASICILVGGNAAVLQGVLSVASVAENRTLPSCPPNFANVDSAGRLRVGAAVGTREEDRDRVAGLIKAGVDVVVLDSS